MTKKNVKLSADQMKAVVNLVNMSMDFAEKVHSYMIENGLDNVEGCKLDVCVIPEFKYTTKTVTFGRTESDSGFLGTHKGVCKNDEDLDFFCNNSPEFIKLLAEQSNGSRSTEGNKNKKYLPSDGLWISDIDDNHPLDSGVSVNDSLVVS